MTRPVVVDADDLADVISSAHPWVIGPARNRLRAALDTDDRREFVVLPRDALFVFLGEVALPPWTDTDGSVIGSAIDCAPIVDRLIAWVDEHDLADVLLEEQTG